MSTMQIMAKAEVLAAPVDAVYASETKEVKIKLTGDAENVKTPCILKTQTMLVYGSPENSVKKTVAELATELGSLFTGGFLSKEDIQDKLPEKVKAVISQISFSIKVIYYTKVNASLSTDAPGKKNTLKTDVKLNNDGDFENPKSEAAELLTSQTKKPEYAVWIKVHIDQELMEDFPISISELSFKVWSTNNDTVLEKMKITESNELLRGAGIALPEPLLEPNS